MALIVQSDAGTVSGANAYLSVSGFKAYHDARGQSYGESTDTQIEQAIIRATQFLDTRWTFNGYPVNGRDQSTAFPRSCLVDAGGYLASGIPSEVFAATAEYALVSLTSSLNPTPSLGGDGKEVAQKTETVGPITESTTYVNGGRRPRFARHPTADSIILSSGFACTGGNLTRG